ncbi:MAG: 4-hydroxy-tetrahydrodipicolinate synthase [Archangium gephyra]|uniref:4-hydroxy-tetrahydrodipicolinate synthase n=1 Tax=Archangium gephyra TaxID=48 RepID=A0A2W5UJ95_9BACT|nr:MAG: 4-hydroxy-tetrahydrodipicolinate synthase [Archangium gephyra]
MKLQGSMTALATPFKDGKLDEAAYEKLIEYQVANGTSVLIPMGTTGEAVTMTAAERRRAIEVCIKVNKGRAKVFAGAGSNSTAETIEGVSVARELGADGALVVTPYYNKPTQAGLVEHYRLVGKAHPGFALMAYNVPGRTGVDMLPETVKRLLDVKEVVALKEATGNVLRTLDVYEQVGDRITLLSGDDFVVAPFIFSGGKGVVSVSSNVAPRHMADLVAKALAGDIEGARKAQLELQPLHRLLFIESNPIPVKMALHQMGFFGTELRPPLLPMTDGNAAKLKDELGRLGLLGKAS